MTIVIDGAKISRTDRMALSGSNATNPANPVPPDRPAAAEEGVRDDGLPVAAADGVFAAAATGGVLTAAASERVLGAAAADGVFAAAASDGVGDGVWSATFSRLLCLAYHRDLTIELEWICSPFQPLSVSSSTSLCHLHLGQDLR